MAINLGGPGVITALASGSVGVGCQDGRVFVWNPDTSEITVVGRQPSGIRCITELQHAKRNRLVTGDTAGNVVVWNGTKKLEFEMRSSIVAIHAGGDVIAAADFYEVMTWTKRDGAWRPQVVVTQSPYGVTFFKAFVPLCPGSVAILAACIPPWVWSRAGVEQHSRSLSELVPLDDGQMAAYEVTNEVVGAPVVSIWNSRLTTCYAVFPALQTFPAMSDKILWPIASLLMTLTRENMQPSHQYNASGGCASGGSAVVAASGIAAFDPTTRDQLILWGGIAWIPMKPCTKLLSAALVGVNGIALMDEQGELSLRPLPMLFFCVLKVR